MMDSNAALQLASALFLLVAAGASAYFSVKLSHTAAWIVAAVLLGASGIFLSLIALGVAERESGFIPIILLPAVSISTLALVLAAGLMGLRRESTRTGPGGALSEPDAGSTERLQRLLDSTFEGIVVSDHGIIVEANRPFASMLGFELDELRGKPLAAFIRPESRAIENTDTRASSAVAYEQRARAKDATVFPVEVRTRPIPTQGRELTMTVIRDMTARKKTEERLRESEESYRELAESITDVFFAMDNDLTITHWNKASEYLTGVTARDAIGRSLMEVFPELLGNRAEEIFTQVMRNRGPQSFLTEYSLGGANAVVEIRTYPTRRGLSVFLEDITKRTQAEQQLKASLHEKEALLKEIHHRVKNNLQIISSLLSLQSDHLTNENAGEALRDSQNRVRSMAMIHEQLYSSGDLAKIDFSQYIRDLTAQLFRTYSVQARGIELALDVEPVILEIDRAIPCGMIINELLTNCLKHGFKGKTQGIITVTLHPEEEGMIRFSVSDDGVGIAPEVDIMNVPSLGMKLVRTLTDQLRGQVTVNRQRGTQFVVVFPAT
jgi:PAS domain S-box-containing protein